MSEIDTFVPVGTVIAFAGEDPNALESKGWMMCDGRFVAKDAYAELYGVLGNLWGGGETGSVFALPDLRGQFLRTQTDDTALDPDLTLRKPSGTGSKVDVGSKQTYGTAPAKNNFRATIDNMERDSVSYIEGCMDRPARCGSDDNTTPVSLGGDKETRPKNKYVYYVIKYISVLSGKPVEVPIGAVCPFAGTNTKDIEQNWLLCDGDSQAPRGVFENLFRVIGYAHGKQVVDSSENYVLPDYRNYFLRGVTGETGTDPDTDLREAPYDPSSGEPSGNTGNKVGSKQEWATAMPVKADFNTAYPQQPNSDAGKSTNGTTRTLYTYHSNTSTQDVSQDGGDSESRPTNLRVQWYIRYL